MDWRYLLTSLDGRISRKPFWIALVPLVAIDVAANLLLGERWSTIVSLLLIYPECALFAKRGHDRNVATWVVALFFALAAALNLLILFDLAGPLDRPAGPFLALLIVFGVAAIVLIIDFGFRRGTQGPNRFGPDPLAARG